MTELKNNLYSEYNDQKLYSEYNDQKLYSDYNDQNQHNQHEGYAVGNWRSHIIIDCAKCHKPMASHNTDNAICNGCTTNNLKEGE